LAKAFKAKLFLFSAYLPLPVPYAETPVIISTEDMKELVKYKLKQEADAIRARGTIALETFCMEGPATDLILQEARKKNADLIIAGMKEQGKGVRKILGSTVTAMTKKTHTPLVVVPEGTAFVHITSIMLANESDIAPDADKHPLDTLREIGEKFHSKLYLVHIAKNDIKEAFAVLNRPFRLARLMKTLDPQYMHVKGKGLSRALKEFISAYSINMVAMLPHKHSLLDQWFIKSATRSMIFETCIPILILPDIHIRKLKPLRSKKDIVVG
jgi:nucleotide-binding universal stress UspA family protein